MKICAMSDMHGQYPDAIDRCDICLICGDIVPLDIQFDLVSSTAWFNNFFIPWCHSLDCDKVVFVGGNHDMFLERDNAMVKAALTDDDKVVYLECTIFEYKGLTIYGTPLCKPFCKWYFMPSHADQDSIYERFLKTEKKVDILISHDAPYGVSDLLLEKDCPWYTTQHIGNKSLARFIERLSPRYAIHGHLHSTSHKAEMLGSTEVYNVSLLGEDYVRRYDPLYLEV